MRPLISIIIIAIGLTATSCAPEKFDVSCPRPDDIEQLVRSANLKVSHPGERNTGIYLFYIAPDSFWACAGIQVNDLITDVNSRPVQGGSGLIELLELATQDQPLELSVQDVSGERRIIVIR